LFDLSLFSVSSELRPGVLLLDHKERNVGLQLVIGTLRVKVQPQKVEEPKKSKKRRKGKREESKHSVLVEGGNDTFRSSESR
jgi:hypothetical protein